jgi:hypothetical protein
MRNKRKVIRTGDTVLHRPTGESWVVAYVINDRLAWCGWPEGEAKASDCEIVELGTNKQRNDTLTLMTQIPGDDARKRYAQQLLKEDRDRSDRTLFDLTNAIG